MVLERLNERLSIANSESTLPRTDVDKKRVLEEPIIKTSRSP